jgi:hypothetical protein
LEQHNLFPVIPDINSPPAEAYAAGIAVDVASLICDWALAMMAKIAKQIKTGISFI